MFQRISRTRFVSVLVGLSVVSAFAYAKEREVIGIVGDTGILVGQNFNGQVSTNESGMSVTFTSDPPGLVNYTTIVSGNGSSVSIPTNPNATGTSYRIIAAPTSGGVAITTKPIAVTVNP